MDQFHDFKGKVVLITGASSGIGAATSVYFSKLNANLALSGRNAENLASTAIQCQSNGKKPLVIAADLSVAEDRKKIVDDVIRTYHRIDVLVNNAGIMECGSIETSDIDQLDRIFDTNVRAVYHLTMLCVPHLAITKGNIVNVSSVAGTRSFPGILAYSMSKAALDQMTKCIALELAPKGVRVNSVNPGVIETNIHRRAGYDEESYKAYLERCKTTHALGRVGSADEVAACIAFLASEASCFVTGCLMPVDGGKQLMCPR